MGSCLAGGFSLSVFDDVFLMSFGFQKKQVKKLECKGGGEFLEMVFLGGFLGHFQVFWSAFWSADFFVFSVISQLTPPHAGEDGVFHNQALLRLFSVRPFLTIHESTGSVTCLEKCHSKPNFAKSLAMSHLSSSA